MWHLPCPHPQKRDNLERLKKEQKELAGEAAAEARDAEKKQVTVSRGAVSRRTPGAILVGGSGRKRLGLGCRDKPIGHWPKACLGRVGRDVLPGRYLCA